MTTILKSDILRILQINRCREEAECFLSMMRNEVKNRKALANIVSIITEIPCDCERRFLSGNPCERCQAIAAGEEALK